MTDGTFSFKPMLRAADLDYIHKLISKNEVLSVRGLDHTEALKGYRCSTLVFGYVLAISFERWNDASDDPTVVFLFKRAGQNWKWVEGLEYGPRPDADDMWTEMQSLVIEKEDQWTKQTK
jgi:hypothetical protein